MQNQPDKNHNDTPLWLESQKNTDILRHILHLMDGGCRIYLTNQSLVGYTGISDMNTRHYTQSNQNDEVSPRHILIIIRCHCFDGSVSMRSCHHVLSLKVITQCVLAHTGEISLNWNTWKKSEAFRQY